MIRELVLAVCMVAVAFIALACDGDDNGGPRVPDLQITLTPYPTATPPTSEPRTSIPELDAVLDVLFSGDEDAVRALVEFSQVACEVEPYGLGSPPQCLSDEPDGALVEVYPHGYCEGVYIRPEDMAGRYTSLATPGSTLFAVYRGTENYWPPAEFVAVYTNSTVEPGPVDAHTVSITGGRIVESFSGCGGTPEDYITSRNLVEAVLFIGSGGITGNSELDALSTALRLHDADVLRPFIRLQAIPCITTPEGIGAPPLCRPDEPPGTRVAVLPTSTCESAYVRDDELEVTLQAIAEAELYAVYAQRTGDTEFVMILSREAPEFDVAIKVPVKNGRITSVNFTCVLTPEEALENVPPEDILAGPLQP